MILRIGELKGLKWSDITGDFIHVQRFVDNKNQIIEDIKGHQKEGKRFIPLTPSARAILEKIRQANPNLNTSSSGTVSPWLRSHLTAI